MASLRTAESLNEYIARRKKIIQNRIQRSVNAANRKEAKQQRAVIRKAKRIERAEKSLQPNVVFFEAGTKEDIQRLKQAFIERQEKQNRIKSGTVNWEALNLFWQKQKANVQV